MTTIPFERGETAGLVSIVIPTHRGERFIGETLDSISQQTYRRWEVIVVEDGVSDGTEKIVNRFARRHRWHRVDYSRNDRNYGAAHTRNVAFAKARGEYVAMLDADDRWLPEHLSVAVDALQTSGKDIAYSTVLIFEDRSEVILGIWGPNPYELADFPQSLVARNMVPTSSSVMRRKVLADVGPWNVNYRSCDDFEFWLRCAAAGKKFQFIGGCRGHYRKNHDGAITQKWCGTWEESASITERFINLPGARPKTGRLYASNSYELSARLHATTNPSNDASADRSRAPALLIKAWRLRPKRISYLWRAAKLYVTDLFRRRKSPVASPAVTPIAEGSSKSIRVAA